LRSVGLSRVDVLAARLGQCGRHFGQHQGAQSHDDAAQEPHAENGKRVAQVCCDQARCTENSGPDDHPDSDGQAVPHPQNPLQLSRARLRSLLRT
jgi:hypothetical protein